MDNEGIKVITADLSEELDNIELYPISDVHWSDNTANEKLFLKFIDYILEKPNRYVVLNGDMLNMALTVYVSDTYSERYHPSEAVTSLAFHLAKLKERILAMGTGNHEDRVYKYTGIDVSKHLAMEAGIPVSLYSENSFVLFISFGKSDSSRAGREKKNVYSGFFHHGYGGGRMKGGKLNMVERMRNIVDTDFYVVGHVHDPIISTSKMFTVDNANKVIKPKNQYYMVTNSWMDYGGYGQKFGFAPSSLEINYLVLNGKGKKAIKMNLGIW